MAKPKGYPLNVERLDRNLVKFDFTLDGERVRGVVTVAALAALVRGKVVESNLMPNATPVSFESFAMVIYIPYSVGPRLHKKTSILAETNLVKALCRTIGKTNIHELLGPDLEGLKSDWLDEKFAANTIKRRLNCLRRVVDYAVTKGVLVKNPLPTVTGLASVSRSEIWLTLLEIDRLLAHCPEQILLLVEYMVLTGARITEALDFRVGDLVNGKLYVPTEKGHHDMREYMREFDVASLGPRFQEIIKKLKPHPRTGSYFYATERDTGRLSYNRFHRLFKQAREAAGLQHIKPHDLRGTFAMHRAMTRVTLGQLLVEMGHGSPKSIESYLTRARRFDSSESVFYVPSMKVQATLLPDAQAATRSAPATFH